MCRDQSPFPAFHVGRAGRQGYDLFLLLREYPGCLQKGVFLCLTNKGHLGIGADADITIYAPHENKETMFELPRYVIKSGQVIVEDGEIRETLNGHTLHVAPDYDRDVEENIADWFEQYYSIRFRNYPVSDGYLHKPQKVACRSNI